jgi:ATP-dependent Clp protease, protease subunit
MKNRSLFQNRMKPSYRIENKTDEVTIYLYDEIWYWGVRASDFVKDLGQIKSGTINLRVNSPGGSVFDGLSIYNALRQHSARVVVHIDGLAASIASIIALAGDEVRMAKNAFFMIHEPWSISMGNADDLRKEADLLDKVQDTLAQTYVDKSGKSKKEITEYMAAETWFTADEAVAAGLVDSIYEEKETKNLSLFDLSAFSKVPVALLDDGEDKNISERDLEKTLRDAGLSRKQAKAIIADGFKPEQRDAETVEPEARAEPLRDVATLPKNGKKKTVEELLCLAEMIAPSQN